MSDQVGKCETQGGDAQEPVCGQDEAKKELRFEVSLKPLDSTDLELIRSWRNDYRIWQWCRQNDFISDFDQSRWFQQQAQDPSIQMYKLVLTGIDEKTGQPKAIPFGVCGLTSIDRVNRRAEFSLYVAPAFQGRDLGRIGLGLLLNHGFKNQGLHVIWGEVFDGNPALKMFEEVGFRREGIRRDFYFRDGKFIDAHVISIKENEWKYSLA